MQIDTRCFVVRARKSVRHLENIQPGVQTNLTCATLKLWGQFACVPTAAAQIFGVGSSRGAAGVTIFFTRVLLNVCGQRGCRVILTQWKSFAPLIWCLCLFLRANWRAIYWFLLSQDDRLFFWLCRQIDRFCPVGGRWNFSFVSACLWVFFLKHHYLLFYSISSAFVQFTGIGKYILSPSTFSPALLLSPCLLH